MAKKTRNQQSLSLEEVHNYNISIDDREIFLHSFFNGEEDPGIDYRSANRLLKNLCFLENLNSNPILIHLHTIGGSWEASTLIYDAILACKSQIIVVGHGCLYSSGSIIIQAADRRIMMPHSWMMIHEGNNSIDGSNKQTLSFAHFLKSINELTLDIFVDVCQGGKFFIENKHTPILIRKYIQTKMNDKEDWYLEPKTALDLGLIDGIYGTKGFSDIEELKNA